MFVIGKAHSISSLTQPQQHYTTMNGWIDGRKDGRADIWMDLSGCRGSEREREGEGVWQCIVGWDGVGGMGWDGLGKVGWYSV